MLSDGCDVFSGKVGILNKSLHGLTRGPRVLDQLLTAKLVVFGLKRWLPDSRIFRLTSLQGKRVRVAAAVYADDLIIAGETKGWRELSAILLQCLPAKHLGGLSYFGGSGNSRNRSRGTYAESVPNRAHWPTCIEVRSDGVGAGACPGL